MTREEIIRNLKYTMKKHENDRVNTFDTNISVMCKDILDYFEEQEPCDNCIFEEGSKYCIEHCPHEAKANKPCDDAISREAEIKKLKEQPAKVYVDKTDYQQSYIDGVNQMVKELKAEWQKSVKWISVSERLPQSSGNYLITYCLQEKIETQEAVYVEDEDKWYDITDIEITLAVIAWMPLPESYEPQERR